MRTCPTTFELLERYNLNIEGLLCEMEDIPKFGGKRVEYPGRLSHIEPP
jgi:hypothetical protein